MMRQVAIALVLGLVVLLQAEQGTAEGAGGDSGARRPNILVIMSDEHNASVAGCYGNRLVRTPNLERLASEGVTLDRCYTNSPLCVPSRLSFTAGKYVSRIGAWSNSAWLADDGMPSIARVMNAAGYESLLCGKMHYDRTRRYGFREIAAIGNDTFQTGTGERRKADDLEPEKELTERFREPNFHLGNESGTLTHDRKVTAALVKFFAERRRDDKPFFLVAGYLAPHFPLIVPDQYWSHYRGKVPMPEIPAGFLASLPLNYQHLRAGFKITSVPEGLVRRGREVYYGLTEWFDNEVGKIRRALDESGLGDNTVIVYTADHGENLGEHGLWWKNCMYDSAARVPLIIRWPGRWHGGQRRQGACSLVDVVRTIAEIGGGTTPGDWNGSSLLPWLDDAGYRWKDRAISEYYGHNIASGFAMLRTGKYKLVYHTRADAEHPPERELYDLEQDPGEFRNLARDPRSTEVLRALEATLVEELGENPEQTELRCRAEIAKGYGREGAVKAPTSGRIQARRRGAAEP